MGFSNAMSNLIQMNQTKPASLSAETESITLATLTHQQTKYCFIKIILNSVISTPGARFMTIDITNFYLTTPMTRYEYIKLKLCEVPDEIIKLYNLHEKSTTDGSVYVEIRKGVYSLHQVGIIDNKLLKNY